MLIGYTQFTNKTEAASYNLAGHGLETHGLKASMERNK